MMEGVLEAVESWNCVTTLFKIGPFLVIYLSPRGHSMLQSKSQFILSACHTELW